MEQPQNLIFTHTQYTQEVLFAWQYPVLHFLSVTCSIHHNTICCTYRLAYILVRTWFRAPIRWNTFTVLTAIAGLQSTNPGIVLVPYYNIRSKLSGHINTYYQTSDIKLCLYYSAQRQHILRLLSLHLTWQLLLITPVYNLTLILESS